MLENGPGMFTTVSVDHLINKKKKTVRCCASWTNWAFVSGGSVCTTTAVFVRDGSSDGGLLTRPTGSNVKIIMRHSLILCNSTYIFFTATHSELL